MLDWCEKLNVAKCAHWASSNPCPVCTISKTQHGSRKSSVSGPNGATRSKCNEPFELKNTARPMCELLVYCDAVKAFPIEPMHTFFVDGLVPSFMDLLFENVAGFSKKTFFVC